MLPSDFVLILPVCNRRLSAVAPAGGGTDRRTDGGQPWSPLRCVASRLHTFLGDECAEAVAAAEWRWHVELKPLIPRPELLHPRAPGGVIGQLEGGVPV